MSTVFCRELVEAVNALRARKDSEIRAIRAETDAEIAALQNRLDSLEQMVQQLASTAKEQPE